MADRLGGCREPAEVSRKQDADVPDVHIDEPERTMHRFQTDFDTFLLLQSREAARTLNLQTRPFYGETQRRAHAVQVSQLNGR